MKLYLVIGTIDWESGYDLVGVFDSEELAIKAMNEILSNPVGRFDDYEIEELSLNNEED